ncbi:aldo/keto reductase [Xylogone sp. PMI_703]|nr:aldo/keto reductase [Xylogone sp. PMI_703]
MSLRINNKPVGPISYGMMGLTRGSIPSDEAVKCMKTALDKGANFWNGGEFYGPPDANSLQLLNYYFTKYPSDKDKVVICMKGAFTLMPTMKADNSPENIRKSIDNCLKILDDKVFIDIWEPARTDPTVDIEETIAAIAEYVKAGKIGGIGLSECNANTLRRAHAVHPISTVEVELSLFTTDPLTNGLASTCAELGVTILAYAPLSHGFLTGKLKRFEDLEETDLRRTIPRFQPDVFDENLKLVDEVKTIAAKKGCTVAQVAIGWVDALNRKPGMPRIIPLPGASSVERVEENLTEVSLSDAEVAFLDEALARVPVQGHRWPEFLQKFTDRS